MILQKPTAAKSLIQHLFSKNFSSKSAKSDIHKPYFISRRGLTIIRSCLMIYSILTLALTLFQFTDYHYLFTLPSCSLGLQTIYFGLVLAQSVKGWKTSSNEVNQIIVVVYELMFSFQLFNFLYYLLVILPGDISWASNPLYHLTWLNATIFNFIAIWIEQTFNMMRFFSNHIFLAVGVFAFNLGFSYIVTAMTGGVVYSGLSFAEISFATVLLLVAPACHFVIGNKYYQHKRQEKIKRRKRLSEALISFKAVRERVN